MISLGIFFGPVSFIARLILSKVIFVQMLYFPISFCYFVFEQVFNIFSSLYLSFSLTIMLLCLSSRLFTVDLCVPVNFLYFLYILRVSLFFRSSISKHLLLYHISFAIRTFLLISLLILIDSTAFLFSFFSSFLHQS